MGLLITCFSVVDFIQNGDPNTDAEHIRGTECDQKILSKKESNGTVYSPNYPFPYQVIIKLILALNFPNLPVQPHIVCRYFIYGMQDSQNLERVVLSFDKFDIPAGKQINKWVSRFLVAER